jgi:hypothetical protein
LKVTVRVDIDEAVKRLWAIIDLVDQIKDEDLRQQFFKQLHGLIHVDERKNEVDR